MGPSKWVRPNKSTTVLLEPPPTTHYNEKMFVRSQHTAYQRAAPMIYPDSSDDDSVAHAAIIPDSFAVLD